MAKARRQRRGFGKIRRLPSKRFQASYVGPDLERHPAPQTFTTRADAETWLITERQLMNTPEWRPPKERRAARRQGLTLAEYASDALTRRRTRGRPLRPRTLVLYRSLLTEHILPELGDVPMHTFTPDDVSRWYDRMDPAKETSRAHSYALLKSLFTQAIAEGHLRTANPCTIRGAGVTRRKRDIRPATLDELTAIVEAMPDRLRLLILLCAWCGLRYGEVAMIRRADVDLDAGVLHVRRALTRVDGHDVIGETKSAAGMRDVAVPPHLLPVIEAHLIQHVAAAPDALLFPHHPGGSAPWQHGTLYKVFQPAREAAGRPDLRLHDLRHTAAVMAAQTGATLAELMARLGHSTPQAALRYQHAAQGRDAQIAQALSKMAEGSTK